MNSWRQSWTWGFRLLVFLIYCFKMCSDFWLLTQWLWFPAKGESLLSPLTQRPCVLYTVAASRESWGRIWKGAAAYGNVGEPLTFKVLAALGSRIPKGSRRCGCSTLFLGFGSRFSLQLQDFPDLQIFAGMPLPVAFASQHVDFTVTLCGFPHVEIRVAGSEACNFSQWATLMLGNHVHNWSIIHYCIYPHRVKWVMFEWFAATGMTQLMYWQVWQGEPVLNNRMRVRRGLLTYLSQRAKAITRMGRLVFGRNRCSHFLALQIIGSHLRFNVL